MKFIKFNKMLGKSIVTSYDSIIISRAQNTILFFVGIRKISYFK